MRNRLVLTYLALLTLVLLCLEIPLGISLAVRRTQQTVLDRDIDATRFASLADPALRTGELVTLTADLRRYYELYGIEAAVVDRDANLVVTTGNRADFTTSAMRYPIGQALAGERIGAGRTVWPWQHAPLAIAVPVSAGGEVTGAVITLSPTDRLRSDVLRGWLEMTGGGLAAYALFSLVALALARWLLRPVARLDDAAHRISDGALDTRVPTALGPPELRRLVHSFNTMADELADALERQRAFVAQAGHQLRNPLTALRLRVEELGTFIADPTGGEEHRLALEETERLRRILDGLLALARAERGRYALETVDAAATADERVAGWQPLATQRGITLRRTGVGQARARAVSTAVGQALDALIDNALKFAGRGATVVVDVAADPDAVEISVTDDGPGLGEADCGRATERFWRAAHVQNIDGTGLGLPIATVLVEASGGRLDLRAARPTGLCARLRFPAATPPELAASQFLASR
ncbi:sensor histidine kinase [Rugosimonospora africana]|uniref:histidine kinase n=1 Tax=Rugosimonospora africana TaxID=556532 RepID=A0A8J3VQ51_9ACTN|nr:HAMP domain-containing sensor histidine kinase [Rugosimonospora africana]GIH13993.1 two-component sensor histidine kinase [Rugosimonospora africana]